MFPENMFAGIKRRFSRLQEHDVAVVKPRVYKQELLGRYIRADVLVDFLKKRFPHLDERDIEIEVCSLLQHIRYFQTLMTFLYYRKSMLSTGSLLFRKDLLKYDFSIYVLKLGSEIEKRSVLEQLLTGFSPLV